VPAVELLGIDTVELSHATRERWVNRLDEQVIVVRHQAVGVAEPVEPLDGLRQNLKEELPI
jgi:hypothetical protein